MNRRDSIQRRNNSRRDARRNSPPPRDSPPRRTSSPPRSPPPRGKPATTDPAYYTREEVRVLNEPQPLYPFFHTMPLFEHIFSTFYASRDSKGKMEDKGRESGERTHLHPNFHIHLFALFCLISIGISLKNYWNLRVSSKFNHLYNNGRVPIHFEIG